MAKFKEGDIVVGHKPGQWQKDPVVILGEHPFPDGTLAYRYRSCGPQYDMDDGSEIWVNKDGYIHQSFLDDFKLIWSRP